MGEEIFVEEIGAEEGWVVGVEGDHQAIFEVAADGVIGNVGIAGERRAAAGAEVARDVEFKRNLAFDEDGDEVGVVLRTEGVADALGADVDGGPDALGAGGLAGVASETQAGGFGFGVEFAEVLRGAAGFVAADADADDARVPVLELGGLGEDARAFGQTEMPDGVDDPGFRHRVAPWSVGCASRTASAKSDALV